MQIGPYTVNLIETCRFALDGGAMFGVVPKNLWSKAYPHVDEQNRIAMAARALLIRGEGKTIVVDAGCGHKMGEKLESIYKVDNTQYTLLNGLAKHGLKPDDVTHFIYTHLHFDHAGGSTVLDESGNPIPTFANARHYVQKDHLVWAENPTDKDRASFMPENWKPVAERELLETLDGDGELFPGIEVRTMNGHTRAMQMVIVRDDNGGLVYPADLTPTTAHISYPYIMGYDNYPLTTLEEKKAFLPEAFERNWIFCFEHDAFAQGVQLKLGKRGFEVGEQVEL